jgi:glycosyltransferase involved in cell wall biosynthesis
VSSDASCAGPGHPSPAVSVIMPVLNEKRTIGTIVPRVLSVCRRLDAELVVVDDGSTDGTGDSIEALRREHGEALMTVAKHGRNRGKGAAVRTGIALARGWVVVIQDADLEYDPEQIFAVVTPILDGRTDAVFGSRFLGNSTGFRLRFYVGNRVLTMLTNLLFMAHLTDMETCYKAMKTDLARSIGLVSDRFDIEPEIAGKLFMRGAVVREVPINYVGRTALEGKKIGWRDGVQAMVRLLKVRFRLE